MCRTSLLHNISSLYWIVSWVLDAQVCSLGFCNAAPQTHLCIWSPWVTLFPSLSKSRPSTKQPRLGCDIYHFWGGRLYPFCGHFHGEQLQVSNVKFLNLESERTPEHFYHTHYGWEGVRVSRVSGRRSIVTVRPTVITGWVLRICCLYSQYDCKLTCNTNCG